MFVILSGSKGLADVPAKINLYICLSYFMEVHLPYFSKKKKPVIASLLGFHKNLFYNPRVEFYIVLERVVAVKSAS